MAKRNRPHVRLDDSDDDDEIIRGAKKNKDGQEECDDLNCDDSECDDAPIQLKNANYRINTTGKARSAHPIWEMFGRLEKDGKNIFKYKDRVFCVHCFEKSKLKR